DPLFNVLAIRFDKLSHLAVDAFVPKHRVKVGQLSLGLLQGDDFARNLLQLGIFGSKLHIFVRCRASGHLRLDELETLQHLIHAIAWQFNHRDAQLSKVGCRGSWQTPPSPRGYRSSGHDWQALSPSNRSVPAREARGASP